MDFKETKVGESVDWNIVAQDKKTQRRAYGKRAINLLYYTAWVIISFLRRVLFRGGRSI
jgi:hypothetical protein